MKEIALNDKYFVLHLPDWFRKPFPTAKYQIQLLNSKGQAKRIAFIDEFQSEVSFKGKPVPLAVIEAARRQEKGKGDYVDENGISIPLFDFLRETLNSGHRR